MATQLRCIVLLHLYHRVVLSLMPVIITGLLLLLLLVSLAKKLSHVDVAIAAYPGLLDQLLLLFVRL